MEFVPTLSMHHLQTSRLWGFDCSELPTEDTYLSRQGDTLSWISLADNELEVVSTIGGNGPSGIEHQGYPNLALLPRTIDEPGFFCMTIPDGTVTGGNARGPGSVDLQSTRELPDQVASGRFSTIGGGRDNKASGLYSTVLSGRNNMASGESSTVVGGRYNTASGLGSTVVGGYNNSAIANYSTTVGGDGNFATVEGSTLLGYRCNLEESTIFAIGDRRDIQHSNIFEVHRDGIVYAVTYVLSGGDYAEMYESQLEHKIPVGTTIVFEQDVNSVSKKRYIRPCRPDEVPVGVISDTAGVLLNSAADHWHGKYITRDKIIDVEKTIMESIEETTEEEVCIDGQWAIQDKTTTRQVPVCDQVDLHDKYGQVIGKKCIPRTKKIRTRTVKERSLNPQFDKSKRYIPRADRPEWNAVGLLGKCKVLHNQPINPTWTLIEEGEVYNTYLVR